MIEQKKWIRGRSSNCFKMVVYLMTGEELISLLATGELVGFDGELAPFYI